MKLFAGKFFLLFAIVYNNVLSVLVIGVTVRQK